MSGVPHAVDIDPLRAVLDGIPSMLAYWDRNLRCRFANKAYERWLGVPAASSGISIRDLLAPQLFALDEPHIRAVLDGEPQEFERLVPGPEGVPRPSLVCYVPHVVDGQVRGIIVQVTEVGELFAARAELQRQVAKGARVNALLRKTGRELELAQRLGEMGSWTWEIDPDVITWSPQLYKMFGLNADLPPPTFAQHDKLYTLEAMASLKAQVRKAIDFGLPYSLELEYIHRSGRRGWLEARGAVQRDASGRVVLLHGTAQEITARHIARQAAAQSARIEQLERELAQARSHQPAGSSVPLRAASGNSTVFQAADAPHQDADAARAMVERAVRAPARLAAVRATGLLDSAPEEGFDDLTSLTARVLQVAACFISIVDEKRDFYKSHRGLPEAVAAARGTGGISFCHFTLERADPLVILDTHVGAVWPTIPTVRSMGVRAYVGVPLVSQGQHIGSFCVVDTRPRAWSADEIETVRQMALSAVREIDRRSALETSSAMAATARAQALERERLVAVVAHDLRAPLQVLQLGTSLLQKGVVDERERVAARMQSALALMKAMVDGLMHAPAAVVQASPPPIEAVALVRDAVEMMLPIAQRTAMSLHMRPIPDVTVRADYGQMLRVIGNLIGNALKYSTAGGAVEVAGMRVEGRLLITVTDDGIGMSADEIAQAFDRGWQGPDGRASGDGAGLGLAIVKSMVEQQHGTVAIRSEPGVGTVVTVALPCW